MNKSHLARWLILGALLFVVSSCLMPQPVNPSLRGACVVRQVTQQNHPRPDCDNLDSYVLQSRRFDSSLETGDPERNDVDADGFEMEETLFGTRSASQADPVGFREHPEAYNYTEFHASLKLEFGIKGMALSEISISDALQKMQATCRKEVEGK